MDGFKNVLVSLVTCFTVLFALCTHAVGQEPAYDKMKYKKFEVDHIFGQNPTKDVFFIARGNIKISFALSKGQSRVRDWESINSIDLFQGTQSFTTKCSMQKWDMKRKGNLDTVREPNSYPNGFSEQDGIISYKEGSECLHLNIGRRLFLDTRTVNEFGLNELIGQEWITFRRNLTATIQRSAANQNNPITGDDEITLPCLTYEYRYFGPDGKEVRYQPNVNRVGIYGTYGDDEKPSMSVVAYKDATITAIEGQPFLAGGLKLVFKRVFKHSIGFYYLFIENTDGLALFFFNVDEQDLLKVVNPDSRYGYSRPTPKGFFIRLGDTRMITAESKNKSTKHLGIKLLSVRGKNEGEDISCQLRFWPSQAIQLLAERPGQKKTF